MRKGREGGEKKKGGDRKRLRRIVATTSLPAVDRLNADRLIAARSCKYLLSFKYLESFEDFKNTY